MIKKSSFRAFFKHLLVLTTFTTLVCIPQYWRIYESQAYAQNDLLIAASNHNKPSYELNLELDTELLTLKGQAKIQVPAKARDPLSDVVFFIYANANGVGGADSKRKNIVVDSIMLAGKPVAYTLDGAVLRVKTPAPQTAPFQLEVKYHGVVPRSPAQTGGAMGGMLGSDIDLSALLGIGNPQAGEKAKPKNTDYGLYTFGNEILSLGSFWYPTLAVRQNGKWADNAPEGLGDVAFSEQSDFRVQIQAPQEMIVVGPGKVTRLANGTTLIEAKNIRECAVLMSDNFVSKSNVVDVAGKSVRVSSYATKAAAARLDESLEVASKSLQIFAKRFGPYAYDEFKVVEAPMRSGAGGMEYSGVVGIASMLYGDMSKDLGGLVTTLNLPGADALLGDLGLEGGAPNPAQANAKPDDLLGGILGQQTEILNSMLEATIAHEVAHQWWAIGVGSDSQNHPFVDEALTNWSSMLYFEDRYGREKAEQMIDLHLKTTFSMGAMLGGDKPANLPTAAYSGNLQYVAVIYGKAALFYTKLRELMGDEAFFAALRTYYARFENKIAAPDDLKAIFIAKSPSKKAQIEALYKRWIYETHGKEDIGSGFGDMFGGLDISGLLGGLGGIFGGLGAEN
jgi:hypothetical protein